MNLSNLSLEPIYRKGSHNIAESFYIPCLSESLKYQRAVGFFSSTIYSICWDELKNFILRGGKMRLICSPLLNEADISAIGQGYIDKNQKSMESISEELQQLLERPLLSKPTKVLASLIAIGSLEIKIAVMDIKVEPHIRRMFHDKTGIFDDLQGNQVVFKGSMNETWTALSNDGNLESVDVYVSWSGERDKARVIESERYFENLWNNKFPSVEVKEFSDTLKKEFMTAADVDRWPDLLDEVNAEIEMSKRLTADRKSGGKVPRPHQLAAIEEWLAMGRRGILEHATGSGKTFTALCIIREAIKRGETPVIFVPSVLLLRQWTKEVKETLFDLDPKILVCGGENNEWKANSLLKKWTRKSDDPRIVIASMHTAYRDEFYMKITKGKHLLFVADEAHRLGSEKFQKIMGINSGPRIALSATPRRAGDPDGTDKIFNYFQGVIQPPYTLQDAIRDRALTPYMYYVNTTHLNNEEQENWDLLTKEIRKLSAQERNSIGSDKDRYKSRIKNLLINRARIVKSADNKIQIAKNIITDNFEHGQRWIVYCDSQQQLNEVLLCLRDEGLETLEYHSEMTGNREETLNFFEKSGGILVSIKCLDEGVDIPSVTHALILASSKNPREFIQRRGRVLRKANNKPIAFIYDVIVQPNIEREDTTDNNIIFGEIARSIEFGQGAQNPSSITNLKRILLHLNINYEDIKVGGIEEDE